MAIVGHPLHPAMIHFPVAALIGAIATDLAYVFTEDGFWARASLWLTGVGAAGAWVSSTVGLIDLVVVPRIRRLITAWCHAVFAVMLLSLASLNWLLRLGDAAAQIAPWGLLVSLLSGALIGVTAFLGGQLVYEHAVGVDIESAARKAAPMDRP
jgi:uncharacterized membrane protein